MADTGPLDSRDSMCAGPSPPAARRREPFTHPAAIHRRQQPCKRLLALFAGDRRLVAHTNRRTEGLPLYPRLRRHDARCPRRLHHRVLGTPVLRNQP